jgi:class 3 adenylate cyclase/catechol 2,3-dioxygenase-like lactoylglutathione lyase family enzyme
MTLKIAELHHLALRVAPGPDAVAAVQRFYGEVLGLESDHAPWDRAEDGTRINAGVGAQIHLVPGTARDRPSPGEFDPSSPHLALAVVSIDEAQAELDRIAVPYRVVHGRLGPDSRQLFLVDPSGNLVELHQLGTCRCTARSRNGAGQARVSGTVLFADMRGFTAVAERLSPAEVVPLLNDYFAMLSRVTADHGGTVFHIAGDGLMAGFGLPQPSDDASGRAVAAARNMISGFGRLAEDWKSRLGLETGIGIGINAGDVIVGDVGAPERPSYTLIGDTVNVAARLVQRARAGEALFSRSVRQSLDPPPGGIVELPPLVLRGRSRPVEIFCMASGMRLDLRPAAA